MKNPYQDVIDWLNTGDGQVWSRKHTGINRIWNAQLYTFRSAHCGICDPASEHEELFSLITHGVNVRFFETCADLSVDGPYTALANSWVRTGLGT